MNSVNYIVVSVLLLGFIDTVHADNSTCYGTTANGRLENAVALPVQGENFISYTAGLDLSGRTFVHAAVEKAVVQSYQSLAESYPDKVFKYAETGLKNGGSFWPHKTHQNGLSVDFMVPVLDAKGQSVHLTTDATNKFGYDIEFDTKGQFGDLSIDYEAMAAHLVELDKSAKEQGFGLWRVIFDPKLQGQLLETQNGQYIKDHIKLSTKASWVRHDEHYHVDFKVPCLAMK